MEQKKFLSGKKRKTVVCALIYKNQAFGDHFIMNFKFFYLFEGQKDGERERDRENLIHCSLPKFPQWQGQGQSWEQGTPTQVAGTWSLHPSPLDPRGALSGNWNEDLGQTWVLQYGTWISKSLGLLCLFQALSLIFIYTISTKKIGRAAEDIYFIKSFLWVEIWLYPASPSLFLLTWNSA